MAACFAQCTAASTKRQRGGTPRKLRKRSILKRYNIAITAGRLSRSRFRIWGKQPDMSVAQVQHPYRQLNAQPVSECESEHVSCTSSTSLPEVTILIDSDSDSETVDYTRDALPVLPQVSRQGQHTCCSVRVEPLQLPNACPL